MTYRIKPCQKISGTITLPGDKSISHRAIIISSLAQGKTVIRNFAYSDDCRATLRALRMLGVPVVLKKNGTVIVQGVGRFGLRKPRQRITVGESGTSMRILAGLLCGQRFQTILDGTSPLRKRPMKRITHPLRSMGAVINGIKKGGNEYAPLKIFPSTLRPINWKMKIASAQVKSAILLASLYTKGKTTIKESAPSRDHTERMLRYFKVKAKTQKNTISIVPSDLTSPRSLYIPGDVSSASFLIVLACLLPQSNIAIRNISLNPTRSGLLHSLRKMGARITIRRKKPAYFEPIGDVVVRTSRLKAITLTKSVVPTLIDELPILMVAAASAKGTSVFQGIDELRVKETDRVRSMVTNLRKMGVLIETKVKGNKEVIAIKGTSRLKAAHFKSYHDHRTAMSMIIAGLCSKNRCTIDDVSCISKSFPSFIEVLNYLIVS